ncbi:MAG: hypothetical protein VB142_06735 [Burkholderia sp.]
MVSIIFEVMDTTLLDTEKPGSRKERPNHSPEFRRRIAIAACEPSVSVAKLAIFRGHRGDLVDVASRTSIGDSLDLIPLLSSMPWCSSSRHRSKNNKPRSRKWCRSWLRMIRRSNA